MVVWFSEGGVLAIPLVLIASQICGPISSPQLMVLGNLLDLTFVFDGVNAKSSKLAMTMLGQAVAGELCSSCVAAGRSDTTLFRSE